MPQSWAPRYGEAIAAAAVACGQPVEPQAVARAIAVLERYNTRVTPRVREVPERVIFAEVTSTLGFLAGGFYGRMVGPTS